MNCEHCGGQLPENASVCNFCGAPAPAQAAPETMNETANTYEAPNYDYAPQGTEAPYTAPVAEPKKDIFITGIIGAFLGACIGGAVIILLSQLGYVASISGLILAICTFKGYQILGRGMSIKGIIVCILLIIATPYLADRIDWAIEICALYGAEGYEVSIIDAFLAVPDFISEGFIEMRQYLVNLGMIYFFALLGSFGTLKSVITGR